MKILIISHNCICRTTNMGKTLYGYFRPFLPEELAQFYLKNEVPGEDCLCRTHYRFTDKDALRKWIFPKTKGVCFRKAEEKQQQDWAASLYRFGSRRTALGYCLRELLWSRDPWDSEEYWKWAEDFRPDVIFFASGDYGFPYRIAAQTAKRLGKPLVVSCVDDYYLYNRNGESWLGRCVHRRYLKTVGETMNQAAEIYGICRELAQEYSALFQKTCRVLHTPALVRGELPDKNSGEITYLGNLELGREENLIEIGRVLQTLSGGRQYLHVYSCDRDPRILRQLCPENGIQFHGAVSPETVEKVMKNSLAVLHVESFRPHFREITRYSVSAKIPDALISGLCLIAYGPEEVASIRYLQENRAAYCITNRESLEENIREILENGAIREEILQNARILGRKHHGESALPIWLKALCQEESV